MKFKNQRAKEAAERKAYRAIDALQDLVDRDIAAAKAERAMGAVREVIDTIREMEVSP